MTACAACGEALVEGAGFCEACGTKVGGTVPPAADEGAAAPDAPACVKCGAEVGDDGYCTMCGHRALEPVVVDDRGRLAYATHRGRRHDRNEDSAALAATAEGWPVLVVSDGVSVSPNPHLASAAAVAAAVGRLGGRPFTGPDDLVAAADAAHRAACDIPAEGDPHYTPDGTHPACTLVVAVVTPAEAHVANVGDARAHLLTRDGKRWVARQLSTDDSVAAEAVAEGVDPDVALTLEGGHAITGWLGTDAPAVEVHLARHEVAAGDLVLACSDGLWNYATTDEALAEVATTLVPDATAAEPADPAEPLGAACERLAAWAIEQGGADNVTVALAPVPTGDAAATGVTGVDQEREEHA